MRLFRAVLVPVDGSPFAEQALPLAVEVARRSTAILQLTRVHVPLMTYGAGLEVAALDPTLDRQVWEGEEAYLKALQKRIATEANLPVSSTLLTGGIAPAIEEQVRSTGADLVILTTHARGPVARFWLGSVADRLIRTLEIPVLLIPPGSDSKPAPEIRRILVPLDRSPLAESVLDVARGFGKPFGASYLLYHAIEPPVPIMDPMGAYAQPADESLTESMRAAGMHYLEGIAARLRDQGEQIATLVAEAPLAAQGIIDQAKAERADLIAIATHGSGGVSRMLLGSVADKVIRGSSVPVLVFRPA
jgi:nucleotide-binding universal stress UspA family protein